ncbi:MAG TPA: hypothetical protein G4O08_01305 [Anaerolineae bacterium]|nr:hypothetical protein [Anaerolineae bacterium]
MARWVRVRNQTRQGEMVVLARWCESHLCRLRGLTFRSKLPDGQGLLLVGQKDSISLAAIHMFGVFFSLGVVWIDSSLRVVGKTLARPLGIYRPEAAARYVLEGRPSILEGVHPGDWLEFVDEAQA